MVIAQLPRTASQDTMPLNVIESNIANAVLTPAQMPDYLLDAFKIDIGRPSTFNSMAEAISDEDLARIVRRLRQQTGRDFENYRTSTMRRQTARRMAAVQTGSIEAYLDYLNAHPEEAERLTQYLLINVTNFFRDPEAFESLKTNALLPMLKRMDIDTIFRAWVPGCATGEEAVSIAITIYECLRELDMPEMEVRVFASDANRDLIQQARNGVYPASLVEHVSEARLRDHFFAEDNNFRVRNHISRMIIWSEHNLVEHPPFSQLHLISCRNVLIYFQRRLQDRVLALFQFALNPKGILFLGSSETMPFTADEFTQIDQKHKIYQRSNNALHLWLQLDQPLFRKLPNYSEELMSNQRSSKRNEGSRELDVIKEMLLTHYNPTSLIVDESYYILFSFGEIDRYLRFVQGANIQRSVLDVAREGLDIELTIALHDAFTNDDQTIVRPGVQVKNDGDERIIDLIVKPIRDGQLGNRYKLVIFHTVGDKNIRNRDLLSDNIDDDANTLVVQLRQELKQTQQVLQNTTQALQAKSEELTTSMEEIRSANEEVQTTNEELRTSKEELESMNEELNTLNTQLTDQNYELSRAKNTLHNFLQSTEIGMVFLDQDLLIREYTSAVTGIFGLRRTDVGRPLTEIAAQVTENDLIADAKKVLDTLDSVEKEVRTLDGNWYNLRIRPYRTTNNIIDGLVMTFSGITTQKAAQERMYQNVQIQKALADTFEANQSRLTMFLGNLPVGVWVTDAAGRVVETNPEAAMMWGSDGAGANDERLKDYSVFRAWWPDTGQPVRADEQPLARAIATRTQVTAVEMNIRRFDGTDGVIISAASPVFDDEGNLLGAVGVSQDITALRKPPAPLGDGATAPQDGAKPSQDGA
jgi:two-component system CheB/CheR fusion protein